MNAQTLRKKFLDENAEYILEQYTSVLRGGEYEARNAKAMTQAVDMMLDLIMTAKDTDKIAVKTTAEVVALLGKGKISIEQALRLMELLKAEQEIHELPKLMEQLEKLTGGQGLALP